MTVQGAEINGYAVSVEEGEHGFRGVLRLHGGFVTWSPPFPDEDGALEYAEDMARALPPVADCCGCEGCE